MAKWYERRTADKIGRKPWLHDDVIDYMEGLLKPEFSVLEHGAGGSTLWLADRVKQVTSIEHNFDWAEATRNLAPDNVKIHLDLKDDMANAMQGLEYDLLFVDGERERRAYWIMEGSKLVKPGGYVIFDNCNRYDHGYPKALKHLKSIGTLIARFDRNPQNFKYVITEIYQL